jgi:hypothetical protein
VNQDAAGVAVADHASGDDDVDANGAGGQIDIVNSMMAGHFLTIFFLFFALCDGINHVESLGVLTGSTAYS